MEPIANKFRKSGYNYNLIKRDGDVVVYEQSDEETGQVYGYEVAIVQKHASEVMFGRELKARESMPATSEWGKEAYSPRRKEDIEGFIEILQQRIQNRILRGSI